jgi:hypothetical protein
MIAQMTYNIPEERLTGFLGSTRIDCAAGSGGRAGTKTKDAENWFLKNNALATHVHHGGHVYGPLPQGLYHMRPHEHDAHMVRLDPLDSNRMFGRGGFLIHGRGKIGSHGCIVPYDFNNVIKICAAVKALTQSGQPHPVIEVIAVGTDLDRKMFTA